MEDRAEPCGAQLNIVVSGRQSAGNLGHRVLIFGIRSRRDVTEGHRNSRLETLAGGLVLWGDTRAET